MQAVILAAGRGVRMGALTNAAPKPMLELNGKPLLDYKIRTLPAAVEEVILVVGYNHAAVENYFGSRFADRTITYVQQEELNGTYGALAVARPHLKDRFLVIMGDDLYFPADLGALLPHHQAMLIHKLLKPTMTGKVALDADGHLSAVLERQEAQPGEYVNCGAYVLAQEFFTTDPVKLDNGEYGLPQTLAAGKFAKPVATVRATRWLPISNPEDLRFAESNVHLFYTHV